MEVQHMQSLPGEPESPQVVEKGIEHLENGEDDRAIECFTEAIRLDPDCARAYRLRGQIYSRTGKWAKAERDASQARQVEARQA